MKRLVWDERIKMLVYSFIMDVIKRTRGDETTELLEGMKELRYWLTLAMGISFRD